MQLCVTWLDDLDLNLITSTILVLDVLDSSKASEDTSSDHDTKLGSQGLTLLHRVSGEDDSTSLVSLGDLLDD